MKKLKVFKDVAIIYDHDLEKVGISFSTNTGAVKRTVAATDKNKKKYFDIISTKEENTSP